MSLLTARLPDCAQVCGASWPIDPDFRLMVELESAIFSDAGLSPEVLEGLLARFYRGKLPPDPEAAVDGMLWFYRCGKEEEGSGGAPGRGRAYDFGQDAEALYTSFLQAFRIDLTTDSLHWWRFRQLMFGLPTQTPFAQRIHYRTADTSSMGREQKKHYSRMKRLFAIRERPRAGETLAQRDGRMLDYVARRFSEVEHGQAGKQG